MQLKIAKIKLHQAQTEIQLEYASIEGVKQVKLDWSTMGSNSNFDVFKHVKLVSTFCGKDVEVYFRYFQGIAGSLSWPKKY